jgi:hypothetical protein
MVQQTEQESMPFYPLRTEERIGTAIANSLLLWGANYWAKKFFEEYMDDSAVVRGSIPVHLIPNLVRRLTQDRFDATLYSFNQYSNDELDLALEDLYGTRTTDLIRRIRQEETNGRIKYLQPGLVSYEMPAVILTTNGERSSVAVNFGVNEEAENYFNLLIGNEYIGATDLNWRAVVGIVSIQKNYFMWN